MDEWCCRCGYDSPVDCWRYCQAKPCACHYVTIDDYRKAMGVPEFSDFADSATTRVGFDIAPIRARVLDDAKEAVCHDRNAEYGEPIDNFGRWAGACNALGYQGPGGRQLKPHDLAVIMGLGKLSRSVQSPEKADTWVDLAGYAAVGYELVALED